MIEAVVKLVARGNYATVKAMRDDNISLREVIELLEYSMVEVQLSTGWVVQQLMKGLGSGVSEETKSKMNNYNERQMRLLNGKNC